MAYFFLLPALVLVAFFVYIPFFMSLFYSFTEYHIFKPAVFLGLDNYLRLFSDLRFLNALKITIVYFFVAVPLLVVFPLLLAVLVNKKIKGISFFRAAYYLPVIISMVVVGITWKWLYAENGLLNYFLTVVFSVMKTNVAWLADKHYALFALIIVTVWKSAGYYMVIYLAGLQSVSQEIYEAAEIDGATGWKKHLWVTVPLLSPYIVFVTVLASISALQVFDEVFVMTKGGPFRTTETIMYYIYELSVLKFDIGYAAALGMVLFALLGIFTYLNYRLSMKSSGYNYD